MAQDLKMIGLVRFSLLSPTFFSDQFASLDDCARHLFAPARMELRFRLFEALCLKSLMEQSDPDFELVVVTSDQMPGPYLQRLAALLAPFPNAACLPMAPDNHYQMIKRGYALPDCGGAGRKALFRLDDDDAVDRGFVQRTKRLARGLIPLQAADASFVIAHNRGFYLRRSANGTEIFDTCERAPLSTGTTLVVPAGEDANPHRFNHRKLAQHFSTYSDISVPAFLRTIHGDNKSEPAQMGITHRWTDKRIARNLRRHFGQTPERLRALLP